MTRGATGSDQVMGSLKTGMILPCSFVLTAPIPSSENLLEKVMAYQNRDLVLRLINKGGYSEEEAQGIFEDTKRFLYLCGAEGHRGPFAPSPVVDEGWHAFILFTEDYAQFCEQFFGRFIHHCPRKSGDVPDGGSAVRRTLDILEQVFGNLPSTRWTYSSGEQVICTDEGGNPYPDCRGAPPPPPPQH